MEEAQGQEAVITGAHATPIQVLRAAQEAQPLIRVWQGLVRRKAAQAAQEAQPEAESKSLPMQSQ